MALRRIIQGEKSIQELLKYYGKKNLTDKDLNELSNDELKLLQESLDEVYSLDYSVISDKKTIANFLIENYMNYVIFQFLKFKAYKFKEIDYNILLGAAERYNELKFNVIKSKYPITGTFIDEITYDIPASNWTNEQWAANLDHMKAVGIDTVIIMRGVFYDKCIYPSKISPTLKEEGEDCKICPKCGRWFPDKGRKYCPNCLETTSLAMRLGKMFLKYKKPMCIMNS